MLQSEDIIEANTKRGSVYMARDEKRVVMGFRVFLSKKRRPGWICIGSDGALNAEARKVAQQI